MYQIVRYEILRILNKLLANEIGDNSGKGVFSKNKQNNTRYNIYNAIKPFYNNSKFEKSM